MEYLMSCFSFRNAQGICFRNYFDALFFSFFFFFVFIVEVFKQFVCLNSFYAIFNIKVAKKKNFFFNALKKESFIG